MGPATAHLPSGLGADSIGAPEDNPYRKRVGGVRVGGS
jgi:hypothetical protein